MAFSLECRVPHSLPAFGKGRVTAASPRVDDCHHADEREAANLTHAPAPCEKTARSGAPQTCISFSKVRVTRQSGAFSVKKIEHPHSFSLLCGADESSRLQHRGHTLWRVNE
jgi:hypothetical protein